MTITARILRRAIKVSASKMCLKSIEMLENSHRGWLVLIGDKAKKKEKKKRRRRLKACEKVEQLIHACVFRGKLHCCAEIDFLLPAETFENNPNCSSKL